MIVEVVAVGTELLLGQIVNSNASFIGAALAEQGHDCHFQQVVGDNLARVTESLATAMARADAVLVPGRIGPTRAYQTGAACAAATGRAMLFSDEYAAELRDWWRNRGREMPESNLKQAEYPDGAAMMANPRGTAPGLVLDHAGTLIFCVPGVPAEMEYLVATEVLPRLRQRSGDESALVSRILRTWGRSESAIAESLDDLYQSSTNPTVAFLASGGEIKVRITAKAETGPAASGLIQPVEREVRDRLGSSVYGADDETIEVVLAGLLAARGWTIGIAESMTGGLVSARLTELPDSPSHFKGGLVPFASHLKGDLLGVSDTGKVVNSETAREMAISIRDLVDADVGVSITGSAGPEPLEQPPGTMFIGIATPEAVRVRELRMVGDRERVRIYGATSALHIARLAISGVWWGD